MCCLVAQLCPTLCDPVECNPPGSPVHGDFPGKNTGVGCPALLQGIFPIQGSNPGLLHCRRILYGLSYQGSSDTVVLAKTEEFFSELVQKTQMNFLVNPLIIFFAAKQGEALYSQQKQDRELTVAQIMNSLLPNYCQT